MRFFLRSIPVIFKRYYGKFYLPSFIIYMFICAWTYSVSYFKTIGISISYSPSENLIFVFERARSWSGNILREPTSEGFIKAILVAVFFALIMNILRKFYGILRAKWSFILDFKGVFCRCPVARRFFYFIFDGSRSLIARFLLISLSIWVWNQFNFSVLDNNVAKLFWGIVSIGSICTLCIDIKNEKSNVNLIYMLVVIIVLSPIFIFHRFGIGDAKEDFKRRFSNNIKVCDYTDSNKIFCGRLVVQNSGHICILFENQKMITCRGGSDYDLGVIAD